MGVRVQSRAGCHWLFLLLIGLLLPPGSLHACSVPVFRYALEKWAPDSYEAVVFHRGPLTPEQRAWVRDLDESDAARPLAANTRLQLVDLDQSPAPEALALWQSLGTNHLPWMVVRHPAAARSTGSAWSGPLVAISVQHVLDSPARREITRRLGQGISAVWVLLEIGDRQRDDAIAQLVETRLTYLASVLKLPAIDPQDLATGLVTVPAGGLKLAFSVVRVSRIDPAETSFVKMLLGTEADLAGIEEPILFPVFGRGRALYALAGKGINHETLDEAATFLIGKCSCQVKELNPGVDLLLAANWNSFVKSQGDVGRGVPAPDTSVVLAPETVTFSGVGDLPVPPPARGKFPLLAGCALAGLVAAAFLLRRR